MSKRFPTPKQLRKFFCERPDHLVGLARAPYSCPIATALTHFGFENVGVEDHAWTARSGWTGNPATRYEIHRDLPDWASRFVRAIDQSFVREITGERACHVLDEIIENPRW